jgi:hypothetical protein
MRRDALLVATLTLHCSRPMPTTTTTRPDAWPPERTARLARAMYPLIFGRPAPAPAAGKVVQLATHRNAPQ